MPKDRHAPTRLRAAVLLLVAVLAIPAGASAANPGFATYARHRLRALGYRELHLSCSHKSRCRWRGVLRGRSCRGRIVRAKRRGRLRVSRVRCTTPVTRRAPLLFGFNTYTTPTTVAKQRAVGATITRLFVPWWEVEPRPGGWNWNAIDRQYQQILAGGLRPLLVAHGAPCWAESPCNAVFAAPPSPSHENGWRTYVRALTRRYPQAVGVEVWNEPNLASEFYPRPDPQRYTELLRDAYTAVKSVDPSMPVISGGLAMSDGSGAVGPATASATFLAAMYADGARGWMDGLGIHVYPKDTQNDGSRVWDPAAMSRWLQQVDEIGALGGVPAVPVWVTEMGVSTVTEHGFPPAATPAEQATDLLDMVHMSLADPDVRTVIVDTLQDADPNPVEDTVSALAGALINYDVFYNKLLEGLGVFSNNWAPKPAACGLSKAFGGSLAC